MLDGGEEFERSDRVGGHWHTDYECLHLITPRPSSGFDSFPMPEEYPLFPSRDQMRDYILAFAAHHNLGERIRFNTAITSARPLDASGLGGVSVRYGLVFQPKTLFGRPRSELPLLGRLPIRLQERITRGLINVALGRPERYGLPAPATRNLHRNRPVVNAQLLHFIHHGRVRVAPAITRFDGHDVHFADGTVRTIDTIVYATGFEASLPFLEAALIRWADGVPLRVAGLTLPIAVVLGDILQDAGEAHARELRAAHHDVHFQRLDVTAPEDWRAAVEVAEARFGRLDVLVNNAGVVGVAPILDETDDGWQATMAVNATGVFYGMRAAIPASGRR